ncbi:MAG: 6-pyruvoyl-tetrahydropterin synthase-related protein [Candidatus Levybacteria bacterium]|nr:6-pyruvoyl-tetrahydropterin synthase-related protein [Candidatus Levybacteria bacterium]
MKLLKILKFTFISSWSVVYFILGIAVIFYISFLLGHPILDGTVKNLSTGNVDKNIFVGNDSPFALSLVYWFDRFFPKIPFWYPLQGMGVSLFHSYPMGTTFIILVLKHLTGIQITEIFRVLSFITFPLTALGIYLFAWTRLKNQTVGLIAALFFLISQASWLFQTLHGIFAQSFSFIFIAPTLIFFDLTLERFLKEKQNNFLTRLFLILAIIFLGITFLMHVVTGTMLTITIVIWASLRFILNNKLSLKPNILAGKFLKGLMIALVIIVLAQALVAFWQFPFNSYTMLANREGLNTRGLNQLQEESLRLPSILGFGKLGEGIYRYDFFFFAMPVLIFFAIGTIMSLILKNKLVQILSTISLIFISLTTIPIYLPFVASTFKFFFTAVYFRGLIPALILVPVVAAWGLYSIPNVIISILPRHFGKKIFTNKKAVSVLIRNLGSYFSIIIVSGLSILLAYLSIISLGHTPPPNPDFKGTYKYQFQAYGPSLSSDIQDLIKSPPNYFLLPEITVNKTGVDRIALMNNLLAENLNYRDTILDVSPFAAGGAIIQGVGITNDLRFINLYHYYASLIHRMWGYQAGVFYGKEKLFRSPKLLAELTDWFGLKYALIVPGFDPFEKYKDAGWEQEAEYTSKTINWGFEVWQKADPTGLYTCSSRPVILAVGDFEKGMYDHVFRSANLGALSYKDAWIVEGKKNIDDYSLEDLKQFDGVILQGYSYRSKGGAWNRIKKYVEDGGSVFVDTGWQFVAKDWGNSSNTQFDYSLPEPLPVSKTHWDNIGTSWAGLEVNKDFVKDINLSRFDPPVWDTNPWGMALADKEDLREGTKIVLAKGDKVLIASRDFGKGKIVWSGINILSHITYKMNEEEANLLGQILKPLFAKSQPQDFKDIVLERNYPDKVNFIFNQKIDKPFWLLFRESFSPNWHATINTGGKSIDIPILRGGPGFILIKIPKVNPQDNIQLKYRLDFKDGIFAKSLSVSTFIFLFLYLLFGGKFKISWESVVPKRIRTLIQNRASSISKSISEKEDDY